MHTRRRRRFVAGLLVMLAATLAAGVYWAFTPPAEYDPYVYGRADRERLPRMSLASHERIMRELLGEPAIAVERIGILVYPGADTLEVVAPMVVFSELMGVKLEYVARQPGLVATTLAELMVERGIDEVAQLDVLVVPGGSAEGLRAALADKGLLDWLRRMDAQSTLTAGVGAGSLLLARAGVLQAREVSLAWPAGAEDAARLGVRHSAARYTRDGKYWSSVGGSAAIDQTLAMLQAMVGTRHLQAAMLDLEYAPSPPLRGGSADTTPEEIRRVLLAEVEEVDGLHVLTSAAPRAAHPDPQRLDVGIVVYPDFFTLDAIGPLVVLSQLRDANVRLLRVGAEPLIKSGRTRLQVEGTIDEVDALDVVLVPGGSTGTWDMVQSQALHAWIRRIDTTSRFTASVCTGSWILGAAGLLEGRRATTNWYRAGQMMARWKATFVPERVVADGKYWTSAGVSAGVDLGFAMVAALEGDAAAHAAMLRLQYAPAPPIVAGTPETTDDRVLDMMVQMYDYVMVPLIRER